MPSQQVMKDFAVVEQLCRDVVARLEPKMKWTWGQALLGYALALLDHQRGTEEFTPFLTAFCDYYVAHPPAIDYADRAAPGLITYAMQKKTGNAGYEALTNRVLDYIRYAPRVLGDGVNHLGNSPESWFYPKSIWVDSLMMFSVFPALYARETGDQALLDFAARQPRLYSQYMQDPQQRLWYHSYWIKAGRHHPKSAIFWGRGNGWVVAALPMILEQIGQDHPEYEGILRIYRETVDAVLACEAPDHTYPTLLQKKSYRELSATALIAAGVLHGACCGYLPKAYAQRGMMIFHGVVQCVHPEEHGLVLPQISAPTIPLHLFPGLCYRLTPRGKNLSYGVAALVFAAIQAHRWEGLP